MQSFAARALYPAHTTPLPDSECLATSIQQQQLQPAAEIDMRLPITSTYLRRMRAIASARDFPPPAKMLKLEGEDMDSVDESLVDSSSVQPASPWALGRGGGGCQGLQAGAGAPLSHQQLSQHNPTTMSPTGRSDHSRDDSLIADDASSTGNKDDG